LPGAKEQSVHVVRFDALDDLPDTDVPEEAWDRLMRLREEASRLLENARKEKLIGSSLEGAIALTVSDALERDRRATGTVGPGLADLFIVSEATTAESVAAGGDWTP